MPGLGILRGTKDETAVVAEEQMQHWDLPTLRDRAYATPIHPNEADGSQPSHPIPSPGRGRTQHLTVSSKPSLHRHPTAKAHEKVKATLEYQLGKEPNCHHTLTRQEHESSAELCSTLLPRTRLASGKMRVRHH